MAPEHTKKPVSHRELGVLLGVAVSLILTIGICAALWRFEWLHSWILGFGSGLAALLGPLPGLLSEKSRGKWLVLVAAAAVVGASVWYATRADDRVREDIRSDIQFSQLLLHDIPADLQDSLCLAEARHLQQLDHEGKYEEESRNAKILRALRPANGHALAFLGYAAYGLEDYDQVDNAFRQYLFHADHTNPEAYTGTQDECYSRASGYCAERTAWVENLLSNRWFRNAQRSKGSTRVSDLNRVISEASGMLKTRKEGFNAIDSRSIRYTIDTMDLLQQTADQLESLGQSPDAATRLLTQVKAERSRLSR